MAVSITMDFTPSPMQLGELPPTREKYQANFTWIERLSERSSDFECRCQIICRHRRHCIEVLDSSHGSLTLGVSSND